MIGIGITTRNRSYVFDKCIKHFAMFAPKILYKIVVVDDNSDPINRTENVCILDNSFRYNHEYIYNETRLGVAGSKNKCLSYLKNCDDIFLFDDDCWPVSEVWWEPYYIMSRQTGQQHFLCGRQIPGLKIVNVIFTKPIEIEVYDNCGGPMMYLTKEVVDKVGAFDETYKIYGYEHCDYTQRVHKAGFTKWGEYLSIANASNFIYSIDFDLVHLKLQPPTGIEVDVSKCGSSLDADKAIMPEIIAKNFDHFKKPLTEIYIPLK